MPEGMESLAISFDADGNQVKTYQTLEPLHFPQVTTPIITRGHESVRDRLLSVGGGRIDRAEMRRRVGNALQRNLPTFQRCINSAEEWAIVGGGPSINDCVADIRALKRRGVNIVSVNKSHDWLLDHGITPWGHVLLDPKEWVADYVKRPRRDVRYFVSSQCHDDVFDRLKDYPVFLWHASQDFEENGIKFAEPDRYLTENWPNVPLVVIGGGTTVGQRAIMLGHRMGANKFHLFGFDSSRAKGGKLHGYEKPEAPDSKPGAIGYKYKGTKYVFETNDHMARQHMDLDKFMEDLPARWRKGQVRRNFCMTFYGSGLTPFWAATLGLHAKPECNANPEVVGGFEACIKPKPKQELDSAVMKSIVGMLEDIERSRKALVA